MSPLLRSDDDDQNEGHRNRHDGLWLGLSAMRRSYRFPNRYSSPVAPGTPRDVGAFGRRLLLGCV